MAALLPCRTCVHFTGKFIKFPETIFIENPGCKKDIAVKAPQEFMMYGADNDLAGKAMCEKFVHDNKPW
jgi:hypothetical protein